MSFKTTLQLLAALAPLASAVPFENAGEKELKARDMPRPRFGNVPYGTRLGLGVSPCTAPGKFALTFDDGPSVYTQGIVNTLQENGVKATFFIVGVNGDGGIVQAQYHDLLKFMHAQGHQLASHTWSHPDLSLLSRDEITQEVLKTEAAFADVLGFVPTYIRPPYTSCNDQCYSVLDELSYHVTDYNLDTLDWDVNTDSDAVFTGAVSSSSTSVNSFISLAHDIQPFTANGFVVRMIEQARAKGFQFVTLGECLGDPATNWYRDPVTGEPFGAVSPPPTSSTTSTSSTSTSSTAPPTDPTGSVTTPTIPSPTPSGKPPHYGNGTVTTATHTSYTTYCPPSETISGVPPPPPVPTATTKVPIPGPHTTITPSGTKPAPYPTGKTTTLIHPVHPTGTGVVTPPAATTTKPPVTAGAGRAVANVAAASLVGALAFFLL